MGLTAAASGFIMVLLSLPALQGQNDWGVTYTSTEICALKGTTVEISCTYTYPEYYGIKVTKEFWFTKESNSIFVDLRSDPDYSNRVKHRCSGRFCTLTITDLRESDSDLYKFRFVTNRSTRKYTGLPGVKLSVTELQVTRSNWLLKCDSSCRLTGNPNYMWFKNGKKILENSQHHTVSVFNPADVYSCAVKGQEEFPSPSVYAPKLPSVSVSPSSEIVEGSSVTLTCSSDANPAAEYTWYKNNQTLFHGQERNFTSISSEDSGYYHCKSQNQYGQRNSSSQLIDVQYAPKLPSVTLKPSAEIVEGSSVTLTCSSDANPAAEYTWYKSNQKMLQGRIYHLPSVRSEDRGHYYCEAKNQYGQINSPYQLIDVQLSHLKRTTLITNVSRLTLLVMMLIPLLLIGLWLSRKKMKKKTEPNEPIETLELKSVPDYINISDVTEPQGRRLE